MYSYNIYGFFYADFMVKRILEGQHVDHSTYMPQCDRNNQMMAVG